MRKFLLGTSPLLLLGGCGMVVLSPSGYVADQQKDVLIGATLLMLIIVIPVMVLIVFFAWRYSAKRDANYDPEWYHSTSLELLIWAAPLMIIICLGAMTWVGSHRLDPFRPLEELGERRPVPEGVEPLEVQVVALDWKWLFIYPEYGIASVSEAAVPIDRPIEFHLTSQSVMNAFYVPALAGMIYAMPGMESQLHAVMNLPGDYEGFSSNYSGAGFSKMRFYFHGLDSPGFDAWVAKARESTDTLDRARYLELAQPSEGQPPGYFGTIDQDVFRRAVNRCVEDGRMCIDEMMVLDARGGTGLAGTVNTIPVAGAAAPFGTQPFHVSELCIPEDSIKQFGKDSLVLLDPPPLPASEAGTRDETL
jgi:cytochrome o ubiquinol oxidase subunit II